MADALISLVVDPAAAVEGPASVLFGAQSEWTRAIAGLRRVGRRVDGGLLLDLHAYEMLERLREILATRPDAVEAVVPFWPPACHAAAGVAAHPGRELASLLPPFASVRCVLRSLEAVERAGAAVFGAPLFPAESYVGALVAEARSPGWLVTEVDGGWPSDETSRRKAGREPVRETASALIVREGRVLLEQRSLTARSHPGAWDTPGGHLGAGETARDCLARELREELGLGITEPRLVARQEDDGPAAGGAYLHHVHLVDRFAGEPEPREGQTLRWWDLRALAGGDAPRGLNPLVAWLIQEGLGRGWFPGAR